MGSGLSDQLLLPSTAHLFELIGAEVSKLSTVHFSRYPDRPLEIVALGMLAPVELKNHPAPESLSLAAMAEIKRVWGAVTAPEPRGLLGLLREKASVFPLLFRAVKAMIARYPDAGTGLSYVDWELLKNSQALGPKAANIIAHTIRSNADQLDPVGDIYLLARLRGLADPRLPHPVLSLSGDGHSIRGCEARVTTVGERVLAGRQNFVELNGLTTGSAASILTREQERCGSAAEMSSLALTSCKKSMSTTQWMHGMRLGPLGGHSRAKHGLAPCVRLRDLTPLRLVTRHGHQPPLYDSGSSPKLATRGFTTFA
jgi:hypothetical protein